MRIDNIEAQTVEDFGEQWAKFPGNPGYYGSQEVFKDILGPLLSLEDICDQVVAEIGSGTGRIVNRLVQKL